MPRGTSLTRKANRQGKRAANQTGPKRTKTLNKQKKTIDKMKTKNKKY
jgi:hypothetical protein